MQDEGPVWMQNIFRNLEKKIPWFVNIFVLERYEVFGEINFMVLNIIESLKL